MNWLDVVLLAVIAFSTWRAYANGFIRELVSIAAVILAIPVAGILYDDLFPKVEPIVDNARAAALVSFLMIMAGVIVGGQVAAHLLKRPRKSSTSACSTVSAAASSAFSGRSSSSRRCLIALVTFPSPDLRDDIDDSPIASALLDSAPAVLAFLPQAFEDGLDLFQDAAGAVQDGLGTPTPSPSPAP